MSAKDVALYLNKVAENACKLDDEDNLLEEMLEEGERCPLLVSSSLAMAHAFMNQPGMHKVICVDARYIYIRRLSMYFLPAYNVGGGDIIVNTAATTTHTDINTSSDNKPSTINTVNMFVGFKNTEVSVVSVAEALYCSL